MSGLAATTSPTEAACTHIQFFFATFSIVASGMIPKHWRMRSTKPRSRMDRIKKTGMMSITTRMAAILYKSCISLFPLYLERLDPALFPLRTRQSFIRTSC